jgi:hypothetical protein
MGSTRPPLPTAERWIGASLTEGAGCADGAARSSARTVEATGRRAINAAHTKRLLFALRSTGIGSAHILSAGIMERSLGAMIDRHMD